MTDFALTEQAFDRPVRRSRQKMPVIVRIELHVVGRIVQPLTVVTPASVEERKVRGMPTSIVVQTAMLRTPCFVK